MENLDFLQKQPTGSSDSNRCQQAATQPDGGGGRVGSLAIIFFRGEVGSKNKQQEKGRKKALTE
jgi:hypothetical protein